MTPPPARLYFDYVDPLSYLVEHELQAVEESAGVRVERVPLELYPPDQPMPDPDGTAWRKRWAEAAAAASTLDVRLAALPIVPWSRKAHELVIHAAAADQGQEMHRRIFEAVFQEGRDIGRIDVLLTLAQELGFEYGAVKAALDVDKHTEALEEVRRSVAAAGITRVPTLAVDGRLLEGFHNRHALGTFLHAT